MEIIIALISLALGFAAGLFAGRQKAHAQADLLRELKSDIAHASAEQLLERQRDLQSANQSQIGQLLQPIRSQFEDFKKAVAESAVQSTRAGTELKGTFESTMALFRQQQEAAITRLREQTEKIGSDAANLTRALRAENKTQGDWGEMVLESVLEESGLQRGVEYEVQDSITTEDGKVWRPDVIMKFPGDKAAVIDSKVSLTAYMDAVATDDDAIREARLRDHVRSIRAHIDELAAKPYARVVKDNIGYVMMFIPNENSYIAAVRQDPSIARYAYSKRIIVLSPSNLLMAVQLIYHLWQTDRQNKNTEKIVKTAADLYDKLAGFCETMADIEKRFNAVAGAFGEARKRLYEGNANAVRLAEKLKELGVTPKKNIKE